MAGVEYRSSSPSLQEAVSGATTVVHLAAVTTPATSVARPSLEDENIRFTLALSDACSKTGVEHLIYASSGGTVYGEAFAPVDERQPINPMCPYAAAKAACENHLREFAAASPTMVTVLRMSNAYGGGQVKQGDQGVVSFLAKQIIQGQEVPLFGNTIRDYVYIEDVVRAFAAAVTRPSKFEIYNISTGVGAYLVDLAQLVARLLNKDARLVVGMPRPFDLHCNVLKNDKAKSMLDWSPRYSLEDGLGEYLKEFALE